MKVGSIFKSRKAFQDLSKPVRLLIAAFAPIVTNTDMHQSPAIWKHDTRNIMFTLVVDDFGIKFTNRQDSEHLASALEDLYVITKDWEGKILLGLTLNWYYTNRTMDVSMPKYIEAALHKFQHPTPLKP